MKKMIPLGLILAMLLTACWSKPANTDDQDLSATGSGQVEILPDINQSETDDMLQVDPQDSVVEDLPEDQPESEPVVTPPTTPSNTQTEKPSTTKPETNPETKPETKPETNSETPPAPDEPEQPTIIFSDVVSAIDDVLSGGPSMMSVDASTLQDLYGLDASLLSSYACKIPMMSVTATEYFVAEVKDGNMDAVVSAINSRQKNLDSQWSQYLPEQYELVKNYKLVKSGNYVLFVVADNASSVVSAFNNAIGA